MITVKLESERLIIRPFELGDELAVYELNANPLVQRYTGDRLIRSVEEAKDLLINIVFKDYQKYGYGRLSVIYKPDNKLIGFTGFKYLPEISFPDLGYRFLPEYWGKGIATESSKMSLKHGFGTLDLDLIMGFAKPENVASTHVLKKLGFTLTKSAPYPGEEDSMDIKWYELTREQYENEKLNL